MASVDFFKELPDLANFSDVAVSESYTPFPADWDLIVTDVSGSTQAIAEGRYREVNIAGALALIAIANLRSDMQFPFVFGGDGVTLAAPAAIRQDIISVLADTRRAIAELYNLDLRVGIMPLAEAYAAGHALRIAKWRVSDRYAQAVFWGDTVEWAELALKRRLPEGSRDALIHIDGEPSGPRASFVGFTCRWQEIPARRGIVAALIVRPRDPLNISQVLDLVAGSVQRQAGEAAEHHPLWEVGLQVARDSKQLIKEAIAVTRRKSGLRLFLKLARIKFETWGTRFAMAFKIPLKAFWYRLDKIKEYQIDSADYRKFDGTLKMVLTLEPAAAQALSRELDALTADGYLDYGMHTANRALLTCVLHSGSGREVHFVDAADGGYALAAKELKAKMKVA